MTSTEQIKARLKAWHDDAALLKSRKQAVAIALSQARRAK
jgi:hypothetical protein